MKFHLALLALNVLASPVVVMEVGIAVLSTVANILEKLMDGHCFDYNTHKGNVLGLARDDYYREGIGSNLYFAWVHQSNPHVFDIECGCAVWRKKVEICFEPYYLVAVQGTNDRPCRFKYTGDLGWNNRLYDTTWGKATEQTFFTGGYCDNYAPYAFGRIDQ
jgi:hypothetical protein